MEEVAKTPATQPCVFTNGEMGLLLRRWCPTLLDCLFDELPVTSTEPPNRSPGDVSGDGYAWDFESEPSETAKQFGNLVWETCRARMGFAPSSYPYDMAEVSGDPYRMDGKLCNTRFGDVEYKTPEDTKEDLHFAACFGAGSLISDGKKIIGRTMGGDDGYIVPTIPVSVLEAFDDIAPTYYTCHMTEEAALADLAKFNLSTQGTIFPCVLHVVRDFVLRHIGRHPPDQKPSELSVKDSAAGINGPRFRTKAIQKYPDFDGVCQRMIEDVWQTVTPVTLKSQYCSKRKTRTILGTSNVVALPIRAALACVTKAWMKAGEHSPIYLGKNKFKSCGTWSAPFLNADLASCDRSTPAIVRHFATNLLFEQAGRPDVIPLYVVNCCHDVLSTNYLACTKRGGLSSGDPVTSISNTIYSLVLFAQHMFLSYLHLGSEKGVRMMKGELRFEELLDDQKVAIYSDDVVLHTPGMMTYQWWNEHLSLALGFKTDPKKTEVGPAAEFLGCRYISGYLVPIRDRVLASLCYHVSSRNALEYYESAAAILMDASACTQYDLDWFTTIVEKMQACAASDGYDFPGVEWFTQFFNTVSEGAHQPCAMCSSQVTSKTACGMRLCAYHAYSHDHCNVWLKVCGHDITTENRCELCAYPLMPCADPDVSTLLKEFPFNRQNVQVDVVDGKVVTGKPGYYRTAGGRRVILKKGPEGVSVDGLLDGKHNLVLVPHDWSRINFVKVRYHAAFSTYYQGPPGCGKSTFIKSMVTDDDTLLVPTHALLEEYIATGMFDHSYDGPRKIGGPRVGLLCSPVKSGKVYVDEGCFCNPLDLARILTHTPVILVGDHNQLAPVGSSAPFFALRLMVKKQLSTIYRFGPAVVKLLQPHYDFPIRSAAPYETRVEVASTLDPTFDGTTITPYHKDRQSGHLTIDSTQGCTYDAVQIHLPTPGSLTKARAIVALSRARHLVRVVDPHKQMLHFFPDLINEGIPVLDNPLTPNWCPMYSTSGLTGYVDIMTLPSGSKVLVRKGNVAPPHLEAIEFEGSSELSPLPCVGHNLGYWFSPDLRKFDRIVPELCPFWPIITAQNEHRWPNRLVVSLHPINKLSIPAVSAGYYVGDSLFLGKPDVTSFYLTEFRSGQAVSIENSLFSTGRLESDTRIFLDDLERQVAADHYHPFVGEDNKSVIGGAHHITSKFLPDSLPKGSVVLVGTSSPGKSLKAKTSVFDVYLPLLLPYLEPETPSKVYKIHIDCKPYRLMVWKGKTCYVQLEGRDAVLTFMRSQTFPRGSTFQIDYDGVRTQAPISNRPTVYVGPYGDSSDALVVITSSPISDERYSLVEAKAYKDGSNVYRYHYNGRDNTLLNIVQLHRLERRLPLPVRPSQDFMVVNLDG
uniref:Replicase polyprotein 1ab n=1 Tax=Crocidura shantungensis arterivirus 1 TaxID=3139507 RepID=A0AB38ZK70_9NIDO